MDFNLENCENKWFDSLSLLKFTIIHLNYVSVWVGFLLMY